MPVIGIPIRYTLDKDINKPIIYILESLRLCIQDAGGEIYLIVPVQNIEYMNVQYNKIPDMTEEEKEKMNKMLEKCDGLFLPGGTRFTPVDRYILDYAIKNDIPTLGVCMGMQVMSCYEEEVHLEKIESIINHKQIEKNYVHSIKIDKSSKLYEIFKEEEIIVNSNHLYQATPNHIYKTVAKSSDGIIEAIEHPNATFNIGLQWHPEKTYHTDKYSKAIINRFIEEANKYAENRNR